MTTLAEFFEREAGACLHQLWSLVVGPTPDAAGLHRTARILRGSAQMAREERVYRAALALETALRPVTSAENGRWGDPLFSCVRAAVDDLAVLVEGSDPSPELDGRLRASLERWQAAGVQLPAPVFGRRGGVEPAGEMREFRAYAAREVEGIVQALDEALRALQLNPMDREALKAILRRQRALHGAARLEEIPVVAEALRAVEDLTRVVAKLNVGVKQEWLDVYRTARDGLTAAIPFLSDDRDPQPTSALARLRHLRAELLARYGTGEAVNPSASQREGLAQVQRVTSDLGPGGGQQQPPQAPARPTDEQVRSQRDGSDVGTETSGATGRAASPEAAAQMAPSGADPHGRQGVAGAPTEAARPPAPPAAVPIDQLEYQGEAALRRALDLRPGLEGAVLEIPAAREQLEELFDLIRLALG